MAGEISIRAGIIPGGGDSGRSPKLAAVKYERRLTTRHRGAGIVSKKYRLGADQIRPLATGRGGCYATDSITVDGHQVGFMYRVPPDNEHDSGWRFFSGLESDEYANDPENLAIYDVNTVANYDPEIVRLLDALAGSAFERDRASGELMEVDFRPPDDEPRGTDVL